MTTIMLDVAGKTARPAAVPPWQWVDYFVPPRILARAGDDLRRARLTVAVGQLGFFSWIATGIGNELSGGPAQATGFNLVFAAMFSAIPWLLRRTNSLSLFANTLIGTGLGQMVALCLLLGANEGTLLGFPSVVLCATLLSGWRSGAVFTGLSELVILAIFLVPAFRFVPAHNALDTHTMLLMRDALLVTLSMGVFVSLYDRIREAALKESNRARARSEHSELRLLQMSDRLAALVDTAHRLFEAQPEEFEDQLRFAVRQSAAFAGAQRTILYIVEKGPADADIHGDTSTLAEQFSWSEGSEPESEVANSLIGIRQQLPWFAQRMREDHRVAIDEFSNLPPEAVAEQRYFKERGVKSLLILTASGALRAGGFQIFERVNEAKPWSEDDISLLQLAVDGLTSAATNRRAERALRNTEQKFASVFAAHPESTFIATCDELVVLECNAPFVRDCGKTHSNRVIGQRLLDLELGIQAAKLERIVRSPRPGTPQAEIAARPVGRPNRILLVSSSAIELEGRPCALVTMRDVTQLKDLEAKLGHAQKMEAVGRLAGGVAHDFNNMLTVISGYGEELVRKTEGSLRDSAQEICTAAARSASLTHELLAFSRRQELHAQIVEANPLVERLESMLRRLIGEHITIRLQLSAGTGYLKVDRGQIEQAIVNLAINARDAMPEGGTLTLTTSTIQLSAKDGVSRGGLAPGCYVRIAVRDDGNGMAPDTSARAEEPFFTTKEAAGAQGLGLSMAHGIVRQSGGALTLSSQPGRGTTAEILLPQFEPHTATLQREASPTDVGRTILLVEDETSLRRLARKVLEDAGYHVIEAPNGREALEAARNHVGTIDLLLSDVVMPNMSGPELGRRLALERPETRIAFMSGYPHRTRQGDSALPHDALLIHKPFKPSELRVTLTRMFAPESSVHTGPQH